jgi:hypothetical protein
VGELFTFLTSTQPQKMQSSEPYKFFSKLNHTTAHNKIKLLLSRSIDLDCLVSHKVGHTQQQQMMMMMSALSLASFIGHKQRERKNFTVMTR